VGGFGVKIKPKINPGANSKTGFDFWGALVKA
jgi:hypothetical protein